MTGAVDRLLARILGERLGQTGPWPASIYRYVRYEADQARVSPETWLGTVGQRPDAQDGLVAAATIPHTSFFRHSQQFAHLASFVGTRTETAPLRVWSAGCATGEEAWSLALRLSELKVRHSILATDVSRPAVDKARTGRYSAKETRRQVGDGEGWAAPDSLRAHVRFAVASLWEPIPIGNPRAFDLIVCRNMLLYFDPSALRRAWDVLLARLSRDGAVIVAPVESLIDVPEELAHAGPLGWFQRKPTSHEAPRVVPSPPETLLVQPAQGGLLDEAAQLLAAHDVAGAEARLHVLLGTRDDAFAWFLLGESCSRRGVVTQARLAYLRASRAQLAPSDMDLETVRQTALRRARQLDGTVPEPDRADYVQVPKRR